MLFCVRSRIRLITVNNIDYQQLSNFNDTQELMIIKKIIKTKEINEIVFGEREKGECKWFMLFLQPYVGSKFCRFIAFFFYNFTNPLSTLKCSGSEKL